MTDNRVLQVTTPTAREIVMTRIVDAPRRPVFEAYTRPELLRRWLGVSKGSRLVVCDVDLRVGGRCRYVWRADDGHETGVTHVIEELVAPERIVARETFDDPWYDGEALVTTTFEERHGQTTLTCTMRFESNEIRDGVLETEMTRGASASFDHLANVLETMEGGERVHDAGMRP